MTDRLAEQHREDRRGQLTAAWAGINPAAPHAAPAHLTAVQTRTRVVAGLADLVARMWAAQQRDGLTLLVRDPQERVPFRPCGWCTGAGVLDPPAGWMWTWPADPVGCPRCRGSGRLPADGQPCRVCATAGPCGCDRADAAVAVATAQLAELLDTADVESASDAEVSLLDLADAAEHTVGLGRDRRRLKGAECPVCGSREMVPEVSSHDRREWSITCYGPDCRCHGVGCPCGIGTHRRRDKRHRWVARHWDGPRGLAYRIGVRLPGTVRAHAAPVTRAGGAPSSSAVGAPTITSE